MRGRSWNWAVTVAHALFLLQVVRAQDPEPMPVGASAVLKLGNTSNSGAQAVSWTWGFRMLDPRTGRYNPYACNDKSDVHYSRGGEAIYHIECDPSTPGDCESCGNNCPAPGEATTMSTGWEGIEFDVKCLKVVEAVEDEWNPLHVLFELDLAEEEEDGVGIYLVLTNVYGDFDVLGCNTTLPGRTTRCDSDSFVGSNFFDWAAIQCRTDRL